MRILKLTTYILITSFSVALSGCATVPYKPPPIRPRIAGIYHEVQKGEALWRISKAYGIDMKKIVRLNRLPDASRIDAGQLIFIPYAKERINTANLFTKEDTFVWPVKGRLISFFGSSKDGVKNKGIDIATKKGASILASRSGRISFRDDKVRGFGKTIIIDHGDGYSTVYAHNSEILVKAGDYVKQSSIIAKAGKTGRAKTTCLHFEIRKRHQPQNPFYYLP